MSRDHAPTSPTAAPRVIVVGGGVAGMAAAVALESAGIHVTLLEAANRLGGRASSFVDPATGQTLDNCQHLLLGCCTNLLDFYTRIGMADQIVRDDAVRMAIPGLPVQTLQAAPGLPAPLHLAPSMLQLATLSLRDRLSIMRTMSVMLRMTESQRQQCSGMTFTEWLTHRECATDVPSVREPDRDHHRMHCRDDSGTQNIVRRFYEPIIASALNESCAHASAAYAIQLFKLAMLQNRNGYWLGLPRCPLVQLYSKLPCRDIRLNHRIRELQLATGGITAAIPADGAALEADAFILATSHHAARRLAPADPRLAQTDRLEDVPILGAHLWFDRPILAALSCMLPDGPLQWIFRRDARGQTVHGVISAAHDHVSRPHDELLATFAAQLRATFPHARSARLLRSRIIIEKRATFSPKPKVDRLRPPQAPPPRAIANLFLAGDYTQTTWPSTMEGAVRSGYLAAEALLDRFAPHLPAAARRFLVPDLPIEWPTRLAQRIMPLCDRPSPPS